MTNELERFSSYRAEGSGANEKPVQDQLSPQQGGPAL